MFYIRKYFQFDSSWVERVQSKKIYWDFISTPSLLSKLRETDFFFHFFPYVSYVLLYIRSYIFYFLVSFLLLTLLVLNIASVFTTKQQGMIKTAKRSIDPCILSCTCCNSSYSIIDQWGSFELILDFMGTLMFPPTRCHLFLNILFPTHLYFSFHFAWHDAKFADVCLSAFALLCRCFNVS